MGSGKLDGSGNGNGFGCIATYGYGWGGSVISKHGGFDALMYCHVSVSYTHLDVYKRQVCEAASGHPAGDVAESQLREAAFAAAPALDRDDLHLDVSVRYGEFEDRPYEHRFYNERTDAYDERTSFARSRPVEVARVREGVYLTPRGGGLSSGGEGSGRFAFRSQVRGAADATVEGGAW